MPNPRKTRRAREKRAAAPKFLSRPPKSFEASEEQFFTSEGSLAPTELAVDATEPEPISYADRLASPRRRALARWVGGVVAAFALLSVAAFATKKAPSPTLAAAPPPLPVVTHVEAPPPPPEPAPPPAASAPAPADSSHAVALREVARAALERGAVDVAAERGIESVEADPSDAEAWLVLGAAQMAKGQSTESRATFTACTKLATHGPRVECFQMLQ